MKTQPAYPTPEHQHAAEVATEYLSSLDGVEAVLLTCSCARGKASPDSCLDMVALVSSEMPGEERGALEHQWNDFLRSHDAFSTLRHVGAYSNTELDFADGSFKPGHHGWTSGPDDFELEIGNTLAYVVPLWEGSDYFQRLQDKWLPYYDDEMRRQRLDMVIEHCLNNLDHIPVYIARGLYFQCFDRLYNAFGEFLQALFISKRTYPIAYDKWVREQIEEILGLPGLYYHLPRLFEISDFESRQIAQKAEDLRRLLVEYVTIE